MNTLRTLYHDPAPAKARRSESTERQSKQGYPGDTTLLNRPNSASAKQAIESRRFERMFLADWVNAVFIHYEVDAQDLAEDVPFPIDTHNGRAYVSLVAFTMRKMRPFRGGRLGEWFLRPMATHQFLNLRTYVKRGGQFGIYFMREWLNNSLAVALGPKTFGLPYRQASICYEHDGDDACGTVVGEEGCFQYRGTKVSKTETAKEGSLDEFLLERYTAFTSAAGEPRFFRVWHEPWQITPLVNLELFEESLLQQSDTKWARTAKVIGAHFTKGVHNVWMGRPHRV